MRSLLAFGCAACLLGAMPGLASAQSVADASCIGAGAGDTTVTGNSRIAQTFTAINTGKVTSARVNVSRNAGDPLGDYALRISEYAIAGQPSAAALGMGSILQGSVPDGSLDIAATGAFTTPAPVEAGQTYALIVTRPGLGANGLRLQTTAATSCTGGYLLSPSQVDAFAPQANDILFAVFVDRKPTVRIASHPAKRTTSRRARFKFSSNESGARFRCRLDGGKFRGCPKSKVFKKLSARRHKLSVQATDAVLNQSRTVSFSWKIVDPQPRRRSTGGEGGGDEGGGCAPGYSPCLPIRGDLDCSDISGPVTVTGDDPYNLDADGDGIGCETS